MAKTVSSKKLILIKPNGNKSNRLIQNLHFEAFCMEHHIEFHNPTLSDMTEYYTEPCNSETNGFLKFLQIDLLGPIFHHSKFVKKVFSIVWIISRFGFLKLSRFDRKASDCSAILLKAFDKNNCVYVGGWAFRVPELVEKHGIELRKKYTLKLDFYRENNFVKKIANYKSDGYILVGVHLRRGDYKTWKKGKYYYSDDVYKKQIESISQQLSAKGETKQIVILFSNEPLQFEQSENIFISKENWYIDHYIMAQCHYLIGPPSTFTLWASIVGNAKLFHLFESENEFKI